MKAPLTVTLLLSLCATTQALARNLVTTRQKLTVDKNKLNPAGAEADTIAADSIRSEITFSGFDKPLRSRHETMFVTNRSRHSVAGIAIRLDYFDMQGRQLHSRTEQLRCDIPSGETRQIKIKSWDSQQSFYYRLSAKPVRAHGTPFNVKCSLLYLIVAPTNH